VAEDLNSFAGAREIYLHPDGSPKKSGEVLVQPDLARTLSSIAEQGTAYFYRGPIAQQVGKWMADNRGLLSEEDFARYQIKFREPLSTTYRGYTILGFPPPSSGGVHVAQILNILENFDLKAMGEGSADFIHTVAEAMKLAFADRAYWLGDPDFAPVPRGLAAKEYGRELAARIKHDHVIPVPVHGEPPRAQGDIFGKHTTHFAASDDEGNWVAITATINTTFGSKVMVPGTGVILNNEMDDFSIQPGVPNYFHLVGNEANAVAAGKRPLSSMSPTVVVKDGKAILSVGAAGGPTIITQTLLAIIEALDFGRDPKDALSQPRFHHQWNPDELKIEKSVPAGVRAELERRGHHLQVVDSFGACQVIGLDSKAGRLTGAADPRLSGKAAGN
jgi:gamma-glutamyltranspeptidase/glutathione hydrolase